jgi:hypothetical protein
MCLLLRSGFRLATTIKRLIVESAAEIGKTSRRTTISRDELCQSDHCVLGHLSDQGPSPPIAQFGWAASSKKSLGGSKLPPSFINGSHGVIRDLQCCNVLDLCLDNPVSELYGQFHRPHGLVFARTCTANCGTLNRCAPFQLMSNQLNLPQVDSNQVV